MEGTNNIIIIGGGIGGLSAAIRLAIAGKHVTILEKNAQTGGKMSQIERNGFRWDTGPSVITMQHVFEDLFQAAGRNFADYVTLIPLEPLARYFYPDGTILDASGNISRMTREIEKLNPRDVEGYLSYLAYAARIYRITSPVFIYDKPPTPRSFTRVPINEWLKVDPFRTMHKAIKHHVQHPKLRQMLGRFATYVGGSPYEAPATLNVIAHVELTGGVSYPQGGVYAIADAMTRLATELGVTIRTNTPVDHIETHQGRIVAVITPDQRYETNTVISIVDVTTTHKHLLHLPYADTFELSCSGFIIMLGSQCTHVKLKHHNVCLSAV